MNTSSAPLNISDNHATVVEYVLNDHNLTLVSTELDTEWDLHIVYLTMLLISEIVYIKMKR